MNEHYEQMKSKERIKILVVDDSQTAREIISKILSSDDEIEIVGQAKNGREALALVNQLNPDVVTMDMTMPEMDGFQAVEQIMAYHPVPIAIVTSSLSGKGQKFVYRALELGAMTVIGKPENLQDLGDNCIKELKLISKVRVVTHLHGRRAARMERLKITRRRNLRTKNVIGIVGSTGGPIALQRILSKLPCDIPAGIVIVQHITAGFEDELIGWLNMSSDISVEQASSDKPIQPGIAFLAPSGHHMVVKQEGRLDFIDTAPLWGVRPSGDILLSSLAEIYGPQTIGVILTGMGKDGARGMKAVKDAGGMTIAQDDKTSLIFGMPKAAIETGAVDKIVPIERIAGEIIKGL
jgi:two-component system chemotaxis response regulator CheB